MGRTHHPIQAGDCYCCTTGHDPLETMITKIEEHGWTVIGVTDPHQPFCYTVGLGLKGHPELYTQVPLPAMLRTAQAHLNEAASLFVLTGQGLPDGVFTLGGRPYTATPLTNLTPLTMARRLYGDDPFTALHLHRA